jgi:cell division protein ZapE
MPSIRQLYDEKIASGALKADAAQGEALGCLERLEQDLARPSGGLFHKAETPRGVYLWGPVGRGKSMMMDLFYAASPEKKKRRVHFATFMAEIHRLIDAWRKGDHAERKARFGTNKGDDPIVPAADLIARDVRLLCFDEFQVTDIADAMILGRLFEAMFAKGMVVVTTSNRAPDDLYKDGLNRQLFLPFIDLLKEKLEVVRVGGPTDFRLDRLRGARVWFSPINTETETGFDTLWKDVTDGAEEMGETLEVLGRHVHLPHTVGGALRATFASLCDQALGSNDYIAIAARFHTVFLEDVPRLTPERRSAARRFVLLIDALYEAAAKLVILAEAEPNELYVEGEGVFEFERTASRLYEMRSADYLEKIRD